jgi:hypothetical protein
MADHILGELIGITSKIWQSSAIQAATLSFAVPLLTKQIFRIPRPPTSPHNRCRLNPKPKSPFRFQSLAYSDLRDTYSIPSCSRASFSAHTPGNTRWVPTIVIGHDSSIAHHIDR